MEALIKRKIVIKHKASFVLGSSLLEAPKRFIQFGGWFTLYQQAK